MAGRHRVRRTEGVPVRRWLQLGAASTGMGAALWAMSVVGPQTGHALADDGGASASSERSTSSDDGPEKPAVTKAARTANVSAAATTAADTDETDPEPADEAERTVDAEDTDTDIDAPDDETDSDVETDRPETDPADEPAADEIAPTTTSLPSADDPWGMLQEADPVDPYRENTSAVIAGVTANAELLIDALAMPPALQDALTGTLWTVRRTLFNLAPTMDQSYSVTAGLGTVVGQVSATDPEGDQIYYTVVQDPRYGSLTLDIDGSYTYTPTAGFDGVDTFVIAANDLGWHVNLLEPFRATGASASFLLNQNAIDFSFTFDDPDGYFTDHAIEALYRSAKRLSVYFLVDQKTVLTYTVKSEYLPGDYLASAGSDPISEDPGFWPTIVQAKLLTGVDANGEEADGEIDWNWYWNWGYHPSVGSTQVDFTSTVMHELLHSFGWDAGFSYPGNTVDRDWFVYSRFVTTVDGDSPIDRETYQWNSDYDPYLVGYGGGMFFNGTHAKAAYGGRPVPLYTPAVWEGGSSISHLDDTTFAGANHAMMDAFSAGYGPDNITLSPVELGILMDIGYTVVPFPWFAYPPAAGPPEPQLSL